MSSSLTLDQHAQKAASSYREVEPSYRELAAVVRNIMSGCLASADISVHEIQARSKSVESFQGKAATPSAADPESPKYREPLVDITDLAAVRVITYVPRAVVAAEALLREEFEIVERHDKAEILFLEDRFGYQSIHMLARLNGKRARLREYGHLAGMIFEVQLRTILQHAWAEIEHDIRYKSAEATPLALRRRFAQVAGLLEVADREFEAIQDEDARLVSEARLAVARGALKEVELTADSLKTFLDREFGADGRMSIYSYEFEANALRVIGFDDLEELRECIVGYDSDAVSRAMYGNRQGQLTRLMDVVLVAMGDDFIVRHVWAFAPWFLRGSVDRMERASRSGIPVSARLPRRDVRNSRTAVAREALRYIRGAKDRLSETVERILAALHPQDGKILRLSYGFEGGRLYTDHEIGTMLSIQEWDVQRIRELAMEELASRTIPQS